MEKTGSQVGSILFRKSKPALTYPPMPRAPSMSRSMQDDELETLSVRPRPEYGLSPWACFASERTSFGREFRRRALYPSWLPLFFNSDHYVDTQSGLRANELGEGRNSFGYGIFLTWNPRKYQLFDSVGAIQAVHVKHPWLSAKARRNLDFADVSSERAGTLFFYPHSSPSVRVNVDLSGILNRLLGLPPRFHPISICLSSHDIRLGIHRELRKLNFDITTVGDVCSQRFVDRFYSLLSLFSYTAGTNIGSQTFYALEAGFPYLLLDDVSTKTFLVHEESGRMDPYFGAPEEYPDPVENLRRIGVEDSLRRTSSHNSVEDHVKAYVDEFMGKSSKLSRFQFSALVWLQFFRNFYRLPALWFRKPR